MLARFIILACVLVRFAPVVLARLLLWRVGSSKLGVSPFGACAFYRVSFFCVFLGCLHMSNEDRARRRQPGAIQATQRQAVDRRPPVTAGIPRRRLKPWEGQEC